MKTKILSLVLAISFLFAGCSSLVLEVRDKQSMVVFDVFDTIISVVTYQDADDFETMKQTIEDEYTRYHQLYDVYNEYDGINNIKTINDNAGIAPVTVGEEILDLLEFSKEWYYKTDGKFDISQGNLLSIWSDVREEANVYGYTELPLYEDLKAISDLADIEAIEIDRENSTVFINSADVQIDVGAVAKGYATEQIALMLEETYDNFAISAGGNVRVHGKPLDGERYRWGVGIESPFVDANFFPLGGTIDTAFVNGNKSIVCSGGYQRYFVQDGQRYHHLIDLETLYPGNIYLGVSIICEDSGIADVLSTSVFFMEPDEAMEFVSQFDNIGVILVEESGTTHTSDFAKLYLQSAGVTPTTP